MKALITAPRDYVFPTFYTPENIALAESLGEIVWNENPKHFEKDELKEKIKDCDVYVTTWGSQRLDAEILDCAPKLKLLTHMCGTVVPFVSDEMWERGIRVISGNDYFAHSVAEGTIAYMLSAVREIPYYIDRLKRDHIWKLESDYTRSLLYKTIGIVSYGAIAKYLVKMLQAFEVKILIYDIVDIPKEDLEKYNMTQVSLEEVFANSDIVTVHTPLNEHTFHLVNDRLLSLIRRDAIFINTSRGSVVDQVALTSHLVKGDFRAVLDVYEKEPIDADDPLLTLPNVYTIPHKGGPTADLRKYIVRDLLIESKEFVDNGKPLVNELKKERAMMMSNA